jgi:hypothetical protein
MPAQRWFRRIARVARTTIAVAAVAAVVASPVSVLAATPTRAPGEPIVDPAVDPASPLIGILTAAGGIVIAIGFLIIMARLLAGIGGSAARATPVWRRPWFLAVSGVALVIGILGGRAIAYAASQGGLSIIGAGVVAMLIGAVVIALLVIGIVAIRFRHGDVSRAIATVLAAAGLLGAGSIGGAATASATGGVYRDPIVLEASGTTDLRLDVTVPRFVARSGGHADCRSNPDGRVVVDITALDLGELGPGTMRAMVSLPHDASEPRAEFFVDAGDLPEGSVPPTWSGRVLVTDMGADHAAGRLAFDGLPLLVPDKLPPEGQSSAATAVGNAWPASISGEMTWSCQPW